MMAVIDLTPAAACDLALRELDVPGDDHDPTVEFSVKELLVDIRQSIETNARATRTELEQVERRVTDRIVIVDSASKDREQANADAIAKIDSRLDEIERWRIRAATILAGAMALAAGGGAGITKLISG